MKKTLLFGSLALLSIFTACDREKEPLSPTELQAANAGKLPPEGNYIPFIYGSKWAYNDGAMIDTTYLRRDTVLKGNTYKVFENTAGKYYMRYAEKIYYRLEANPMIQTDATGLYERIELRTDLGIGTKYEQRFTTLDGGYYRVETTFTNLLKERYVNNKKYNTVLEVMNRLFLKTATAQEYQLGTSYHYFAKDKGLVEVIETGGGKRLLYYNY
jgi:hypothetical protein